MRQRTGGRHPKWTSERFLANYAPNKSGMDLESIPHEFTWPGEASQLYA
jgi:hypothetical protein